MSTDDTGALKAALLEANLREKAAMKVAQDLREYNQDLLERVRLLQARVRELENPKGRRSENQSWIDKIVLIITRVGRPMRARDIMSELKAMDRDYAIEALLDPEKSLSVALARAVKAGRLKQFKTPGTRGSYYAIPKWVDKNGNLSKAMRDEMY